MCSSCKKSGQWDTLQSFLTSNKGTKKWKTMQHMTNEFPELEYLKQTLININNKTKSLSTLPESDLCEILKKFELPVSCIKPADFCFPSHFYIIATP